MYVASLDFERDNIFGIFDRKLALLGVAHLAYGDLRRRGGCAEFGVSVVSKSRGRRYGTRMFERAAMHARNMGVRTLFIHALSENVAMLKIARAAGARVHRDGAECEAYLKLPAPTLNSRLTEFLNAKIAEGDYHLKRHAKQLRRTVADWNSVQPSVGEEAKNKPM
jgi:RimJ/RimL family protein N-acetyltransferase